MAKITSRVAMLLAMALLVLLQEIHCESNSNDEKSWSSSVADMEMLLEMECQLLTAMEDYAQKLEHKINVIRGALTEMRTEHQKSEIDSEKYLSNPINSYALIRRLHEDWVNWELFLRSPVGADEISRIEGLRADLPTSVDLYGAAEAIYRLSVVYDIKPADLTVGRINGKQYDARFTGIDCFSIGYIMFQKDMYYLSQTWLNLSLQLYQDSDINAVRNFDKIKILQLHAKVLIKQDSLIDDLDTRNNSTPLTPDKAKLLHMKSETEFKIRNSTGTTGQISKPKNHYDPLTMSLKTNCRQYTYQSGLHCLYNKTTSPFLQLAPLKMEILHLNPYMVLYHDVVSDAEIATLKKEAKTKLSHATTFSPSKNISMVDNVRTAKGFWFRYNITFTTTTTFHLMKRLEQRMADMSGLDIRYSEILQITNYGMGGHYAAHYDAFNLTANPQFRPHVGDRMATVLFYMNDVEQGGATVFPKLQLSVIPKKGTALMWHNLNKGGEPNPRSLHVSCPVIIGSKWIVTKWITQYGQMFRKPCYA